MLDNLMENVLEEYVKKVGDGSMENAIIGSIKELSCSNPTGTALECRIKTIDLPMIGDLDLKFTLEKDES